jgi:hypothetical protein
VGLALADVGQSWARCDRSYSVIAERADVETNPWVTEEISLALNS